MVFDDEVDVLLILRLKIQAMGFRVITNETCENIVDVVKENQPDLIIIDNWIPDIGGIEATRRLKKDSVLTKIPVIMCTASKDAKILAASAGANGYIEKPFDLKTLEQVISEHVPTP